MKIYNTMEEAIASGASTSAGQFAYSQITTSDLNSNGELVGRLDVLSDSSANHISTGSSGPNGTGFLVQAGGFVNRSNSPLTPLVDFSAASEVAIVMKSAAETAVNITAASWAAGVATYTATAHTLAVGDKTVIAGITPSGYNIAAGGIVLTVPDANTFTIAVVADPGAYTSGGTSSRISNMVSQSYVLSLIG